METVSAIADSHSILLLHLKDTLLFGIRASVQFHQAVASFLMFSPENHLDLATPFPGATVPLRW